MQAGTGSVFNLLTLPLWTHAVSQPLQAQPSLPQCSVTSLAPLWESSTARGPGALSFPSFTLSRLPVNPKSPLRLHLGRVPPAPWKMNSCIMVIRLLLSGPFLFGRQEGWGGEGTCVCAQGNCKALWNQSKWAAVLSVGSAIGNVGPRNPGGRREKKERKKKYRQGLKEKTEKGDKGGSSERRGSVPLKKGDG